MTDHSPTGRTLAAAHAATRCSSSLFTVSEPAMRIPTALTVLLVATACSGPAPESDDVGPGSVGAAMQPGQQAVSLFGEPLFQQEDTTGAIAEADALLAGAPDDVDRLICTPTTPGCIDTAATGTSPSASSIRRSATSKPRGTALR